MHISEVFSYLKSKVSYLNGVKEVFSINQIRIKDLIYKRILFLKKKNELNSTSDLKEFIKGDLKDFSKAKESVSLCFKTFYLNNFYLILKLIHFIKI